jgi:hypothetical protein
MSVVWQTEAGLMTVCGFGGDSIGMRTLNMLR